MTDFVKQQYEERPYPTRDPADEKNRLITGSPSHPDELNHYLFAGRRDWSKPFRVLVAGGGTGDALIMLAQILAAKNCPAEITYIDLSTASRAIAEARAKARKLPDIKFITASLLDAADYGPFDYIDCCGVLHHLPEPAEGFRALERALAGGGGIGVMVYGELGRTGVYDMQEMLQLITPDTQAPEKRIKAARELLEALPPTNRFKRNPFIGDHKKSDAELFDLLLHSQDRAYRVEQIYDTLDAAGLDLVSFIAPGLYDPLTFLHSGPLAAALQKLGAKERAIVAENLIGNIRAHVFYCVKQGEGENRIAQPTQNMIPQPHQFDASAAAAKLKPGQPLPINLNGLKIKLPLPPQAIRILNEIDGRANLEDIHKSMQQTNPGLDWISFFQSFIQLYQPLNKFNLLLLKGL